MSSHLIARYAMDNAKLRDKVRALENQLATERQEADRLDAVNLDLRTANRALHDALASESSARRVARHRQAAAEASMNLPPAPPMVPADEPPPSPPGPLEECDHAVDLGYHLAYPEARR